ncbi:hypothetical protein FHS51_001302 [Sphingobium wenxiniae]|uniref:Uncharacterized protein n=2 Tax=Sphingobium TaxID=165695 RepID=T0HC61_9SPHN|nr:MULTISPECIES: hypothetical protein [Sphingobium]EQA96954.1 hypothetical protein L485_23030 [Sphingobium baderi LL03]KMS64281.1 hypothetical protein V475_17515 [Sphingobium baderi LL03]MBB6191080.1 hypothetical protein [Sphingobium wenxiniae]TWH96120.1 hypothetical protein IQ35_01211 [Sphingobium wenxiniae]
MKFFFLPVLATLGMAVPAYADKAREDARARKIMYDYARCVVKIRHDRAAEAIIANADNSTILKEYPDLINGACLGKTGGMGTQMTFGGDLYRYALADALVNADYSKKHEIDFSNRLPLAHIRSDTPAELDAKLAGVKSKRKRAEILEENKETAAIGWVSRYGECVVREDPIRARFWLLTPPDSPEETSRIDDLRPIFAHCLPEGTMNFNRVTMRGTVAINYFRLANATPQQTAEKAQ